MHELFIYYRAPQAEAAHIVRLVREFQARLTAGHPGLVARLLCRPEVVEGAHTWMETYSMNAAHSPDGIRSELADEIERQASCLAPCRIGSRHVEVFAPCA